MIHDDTPGATQKRTTVNGNRVILWKFTGGREYNTTGRQVAAALPRDMDGLSRVEADADGASLYIEEYDGPTSDMYRFEPPAGYEITKVGQFHDGDVCVQLEVADD